MEEKVYYMVNSIQFKEPVSQLVTRTGTKV